MTDSTDWNAVQQAFIKRNDIVVRVAKMIDPGAFMEGWHHIGADGIERPVEPDARMRYKQAQAIMLAVEILKLASRHDDLSEKLADSEAAHWELFGVPVNDHPEARKIIEDKYA